MSQPNAPEPCPVCKGKCCRNQDLGYRVEHMGAECYEHVCDYCWEGDKFVPARTAEDERADVLAWLRDVGTSASMSADEMVTLHWVSRAIFGKEHVGYAKKEKP